MDKDKKLEERLREKARLVIKVNYFSSIFSLVFAAACFFFPGHYRGHSLCIFIVRYPEFCEYPGISVPWQSDPDLPNIVSIMTLTCASIITLYSGGINSPFIFILALIVVAGYVTTKSYGTLYLNLNLLIIVLIYSQSIVDFSFVSNVVPGKSRNLFALFSVLFSVYLLGGVFGKNLLHAHHNLYKVKNELEEKITEKETLIKEVHHRVKNNLQTVSSLISLQSRNIGDKEVKKLLKSSQNRVISMAMVHEMLYMREDLSNIEYRSYVRELAEYLVRSIKGTSSNITLDIDIPDIKLNIDTAIPLGLLINEVVTNSLKYGIMDKRKGTISIKLDKEDETFVLKINDDGTGFPDTLTHKNSKSLGLKLIHNLARQLQGTIVRDVSQTGTHYTARFKEIRDQLPAVV